MRYSVISMRDQDVQGMCVLNYVAVNESCLDSVVVMDESAAAEQ